MSNPNASGNFHQALSDPENDAHEENQVLNQNAGSARVERTANQQVDDIVGKMAAMFNTARVQQIADMNAARARQIADMDAARAETQAMVNAVRADQHASMQALRDYVDAALSQRDAPVRHATQAAAPATSPLVPLETPFDGPIQAAMVQRSTPAQCSAHTASAAQPTLTNAATVPVGPMRNAEPIQRAAPIAESFAYPTTVSPAAPTLRGGPAFVERYSNAGIAHSVISGPARTSMHANYANHSQPLPLMDEGRSSTPVTFNVAQPYQHRRLHDLPVFGGRPEDWPLFYHSYINTTEAYGYTDLENLMRLQKCLVNEARNAVLRILIHPRHVDQVISTLEKAFGRPEVLLRSQLKAARELPNITEERIADIVSFAISVQNLATFLDTDETQHHLSNPALLEELVDKLPMSRRIDWANVSYGIRPYPTVKDFAIWVDRLSNIVNRVAIRSSPVYDRPAAVRSNATKPQNPKKPAFLGVTHTNTTCGFCDKRHEMTDCRAFRKLSVDERWKEVKKRSLCFSCLRTGHLLPSCEHKQQCKLDGCELWHNTALHAEPRRGASSAPTVHNRPTVEQSITTKHSATAVLTCRKGSDNALLLFRVVPVVLHANGRRVETHALLDDGSAVTLMDDSIADELALDGPQSELNVQWIGGQTTSQRTKVVSLEISGTHGERFAVDVRTVKGLSLPTQTIDAPRLKNAFAHLRDVPLESYEHAEPKLLIGLDCHHLSVPIEMAFGDTDDDIVASKTRLGWCVYGSDRRNQSAQSVVLHVALGPADCSVGDELSSLVRAFIETEDFGVKSPDVPIESDEHKRARMLLTTTTRRIGERFETGLLWRSDDESLPDSRPMALQRLMQIEAKMRRNGDYCEQYKAQIADYVAKGYARLLPKSEADVHSRLTWYLPHFLVSNPNKPGKLRLVFDAAAKANGKSLNNALLAGPDENVPMTRLLFRFRIGSIAVCADVREMFHQVRIRSEDQCAQRFLWRNGDSTREPDTYAMQVMTFGSTCSPASAQFVKNLNATEHRQQHAEAADAIIGGHYVDDYVVSFATAADAARITTDVVDVQKRGGFELRRFVSNSPQVLAALGADTGGGENVRLEAKETPEKILGMNWNTSEDVFVFRTQFHRVDTDVVSGRRPPTKREMLKTVMSVFDPFGLLADFMLTGKLLLQDLWRVGTAWDEPVPIEIDKRWQEWRSQIAQTQHCKIPRCYSANIKTTDNLQLHIFADASETAFAAVAYWRVVCGDTVQLSFVAGKTKCAPLKLLSIPRLELQAAVLATRLMNEIRTSHDELPIRSVTMWTDSQTVLQWLRSDTRRYKPFVAFRVAEIVDSVDPSGWRWCPTAMNVADDATRAKQSPTFDPNSRWLHGPSWLTSSEDEWPMPPCTPEADVQPEEVRKRFVAIVLPCSYIERFSRYGRLLRVTAWILRFVHNARVGVTGNRASGELSAADVDSATRRLCRIAQIQSYPAEYATVRDGKSVSTSSELFKLNLYLDEDGLLRLHGRTDTASDDHLPLSAKRPILLPRHHHLTKLVVLDEHERHAHQFEDATAAAVRRSFWVPQIRVLVRSVRRQCMVCRIRTARPSPQAFGQMPKDRLTPLVRPFLNTGLDYFGPVDVVIGRRREKRWVAIFTCLSTRAVHLEIAADLSTDSCLMCIRNLSNLRGPPARIRCDNGTNFVGARNELEREPGFFDANAMQRELSLRNVEWVFNCPGNPEAGGAWERLIQSVKRVLNVTLNNVTPRVETLRSLLLEAANILNARPLTHMPVDANEPDPITPNHFLMGGVNATMAPAPTDDQPLPTRRQWKLVQELSRRFWKRWINEYLPELTRRSRHYVNAPVLKVGDLVLICDGNQQRGQWLRGRVTSTKADAHGVVRQAEVQTASGVLRRPATRLAILDVKSASP